MGKEHPQNPNPEWQTISDFSQSTEFLKDLERIWNKNSTKRGKSFKEELKIENLPKSTLFPYGAIKLKFFRETENYLKSDVECNTTFIISYDKERGLIVTHKEFIDGQTIKKFEGTLQKFYTYKITLLLK